MCMHVYVYTCDLFGTGTRIYIYSIIIVIKCLHCHCGQLGLAIPSSSFCDPACLCASHVIILYSRKSTGEKSAVYCWCTQNRSAHILKPLVLSDLQDRLGYVCDFPGGRAWFSPGNQLSSHHMASQGYDLLKESTHTK